MSVSPNTDPQPGTGAAGHLSHRSGLRRYVRAFADGASRHLSPQRLTTRPAMLVVVLVAAVAVPLAIGALPILLKSKPAASSQPPTAAVPVAIATALPSSLPPSPPTSRPRSQPAVIGAPATHAAALRRRAPAARWAPARQPAATAIQVANTPTGTGPAATHAAAKKKTTKTTTTTSAIPAQIPATFWAVTGYGCTQNINAAFSEHGRWTGGLSGFIAVPTGSLSVDGCDGAFDAMPMSGSATQDDRANYALWTFHTGGVTRGVCNVDVYVPGDTSAEHVGGHPAYYQVFASLHARGAQAGSFLVNQRRDRDQWVSGGAYRVTRGTLTIKLHSRGIDWVGNTETNAHIAVSPIRVTCRSDEERK